MPICRNYSFGYDPDASRCPQCYTPANAPLIVHDGLWNSPFARFSLVVGRVASVALCIYAVVQAGVVLFGGVLVTSMFGSLGGASGSLMGFGFILLGLLQQLVLFCVGGMVYRYLTLIR